MRLSVRLLGKLRRPPADRPRPRHTPGSRLYCIGDVHGRADLLQRLHALIRKDAAGYPGRKQAVYLGDYIDRGDHSREVIDMLLDAPLEGFDIIHLRGNHEQAMLDFLEYPDAAAGWLAYGGLATLLSYGVRLHQPPRSDDLPDVAARLNDCLPEPHRAFLQSLPLKYQEADYAFVHAGIRPGVALDRQHADDLLWIRDAFLRYRGSHEYVVVHGHSITEEVEMLPNRIGIDTGAFHTGVLTCLVLEGDTRRLIQASQ